MNAKIRALIEAKAKECDEVHVSRVFIEGAEAMEALMLEREEKLRENTLNSLRRFVWDKDLDWKTFVETFDRIWNAARANDPRVTKIGENVTTENVSNENVSNESDEKLRDELAENHKYHQRGSFIGVVNAFKDGWNAARANAVADPRVAELVRLVLEIRGVDMKCNNAYSSNSLDGELFSAAFKIADELFEGRGT